MEKDDYNDDVMVVQQPDGRWAVIYGGSTVTAPDRATADWHAESLREVLRGSP